MHRTSLLFLALTACTVPAADAGGSDTPYDCTGVPSFGATDGQNPAIERWHAHAHARVTDAAWLASVRDELAVKLPAAMTVTERVRLQHELLEVAKKLDDQRRWGNARTLADNALTRVMALARAIAPTAEQLRELGSSHHPHLQSVLGNEIVERATRQCGSGNLVHVRKAGGLLAYRPLRAGTTRALVAELVAFDDTGEAHLTPLVDGIELRLGNEQTSAACVVRPGADGLLRPVPFEQLEEHGPFVVKTGVNQVGCNGCHFSPDAMNARDLTFAETIQIDAQRDGQVERLAKDRWRWLTSPVEPRTPAY